MRTLAARRYHLAALLAIACSARVRAQSLPLVAAPTSTWFDTSIRSAAMGGASAAVFWGEPGVWANPATLAGVNGAGWVAGRTHVDREIDNRVVFSSQRLLMGGGGLGVSLMGQPISGLGKAQYEQPLVTPPSFVNTTVTESWGVGVSPLRLIESVRGLGQGSPRSLTRYGDITFGYQAEESKQAGTDIGEGETYDWGVGGRLALARWWGPDPSFRLDFSGSYSQVNVLTSSPKNVGAASFQLDRTGFALHFSPLSPVEHSSMPQSLPWWRRSDDPKLSLGVAYDHDQRRVDPFGTSAGSIEHIGFEADVFRLLALRMGHVSDPALELAGWTYGGGLTLPVGPWGSLGYQLASVPNNDGLDRRQFQQGWSVWIDPTRIWGGAYKR